MSFEVINSSYSSYIENTLKSEYTHIKNLRNSETTIIDLYQNNDTGDKIIRIYSKNQNSDVFRHLRGCRHKNLPEIYDTCVCENCICILESYVKGKTLAEIITQEKISVKTAVKYAADICSALSFLHSRKIVHRDIKPENILITEDGTAILIDLQASRFITDIYKKDTVNLGTVGYAAPEQFGISPSRPTTDIYALGVLLNEMLLGIHPTEKVPKGQLGKIIKKCTNTQISDRYTSVDKLQKALNRYINLRKFSK